MEIDELTIIAYHEASHAVAHYLLRIPFVEVSIIPDNESLGCVKAPQGYGNKLEFWKYDNPGFAEKKIIAEMMTSFAGNIGAEKFTGTKPGVWSDTDKDAPFALVGDLSSGPEDDQRILDETWQKTKEMLDDPKNWGAVQALAAELLKRKVISGPLARKIIRASFSEE